jgi:hypothetical protein
VEGKWKPPGFEAGHADASKATEYHFLKPLTMLPPVFLDPALSAASFFSEVAVEINGIPLEPPSLSKNGWVYNAFNRVFCSEKIKREKYDGDVPRVSNENDRKPDNLETSPGLKAAFTGLDFDAALTSKAKLLRFNFDGIFPFDFQSNVSRALSGVVNENGFLPPGTSVKVTLTKRDPLSMSLENSSITDVVYYTQASLPAANIRYKTQWEFKALELTYESLVLKDQTRMDKIRRNPTKYYVDVPRLLYQEISPGQQFTVNTVKIPVGATYVAVCFMKTTQIQYNPTTFKNLAARFHFIPGAAHVDLEMEGKPMLFDKGLDKCGIPEDAHVSRTCVDYHKDLVHKELYGKDFSSMFPKQGYGYDQFLICDLGHKEIKEPTEMTVSVTYDANSSPTGWYLCSITSQQCLYVIEEKKGVKSEVMI